MITRCDTFRDVSSSVQVAPSTFLHAVHPQHFFQWSIDYETEVHETSQWALGPMSGASRPMAAAFARSTAPGEGYGRC